MNKVNIDINPNEYASLKEKSLLELLEDPTIQAFLHNNHLTSQYLKNHWLEFLEYRDDHNICNNCKGIENCPKHTLGMQKVLSYVGDEINLDVQVCHYGNDLNKKNAYLSHYIIRNVSDDLLMTSFKELQIVKKQNLSKNEQHTLTNILKYIKSPTNKGFFIHSQSDERVKILGGMLKDILKDNDTACFINLPAYIIDKKSNFNTNNNYDLDDLLHCKYLVIDALGEENITTWSRDEILSSIISYRALNELPTFISSIYDYNDLTKLYTIRKEDALKVKAFISKIKSMCIELMLDD